MGAAAPQPGRHDTLRALVGSYRGVIVCDALKTHEAGARGNEQIQLAGCWAHYPERAVIRSFGGFVGASRVTEPRASG